MKLTIERLGHLGDGVAQGPNGPIFVSAVLPGEVVDGELSGDRLTQVRIVTPTATRVKPPCAHAKSCGGCLMQHANDSFVADWKIGIVRGALEGQGLEAEIRGIVTSPPRSRRRATFAARRTKSGALIGFHARGSDVIIPIPDCQLLHSDLMAAIPGIEALVKIGGSRTQELSFTVTRSDAGADVVADGGKPLDGPLRMELARVVETFGFARLKWDDEVVALRANPVQQIGSAKVVPPPGAFLQATEHGQKSLVALVKEALGPQKKIVDLFAGCGTFALPLAEGAELHAVEGDAEMMAALDKAARQTQGLKRVSVETRDLFRRPLEADEFKHVTGVVIDPPRAGAEAQIVPLAGSGVPVIAMVSCNPATFARDAKSLIGAGYRLEWVQVVDQFRWSSHVELVGCFRLAHM
ncbi:class I SAM-dependent RNA methyltransferase [Thioclava sp. FR2]|uniref:class I SAM-dependent RNA methyltransferase n=1 Tax=Thioclava sp. FR2 TaxID=3445780 RepID=UPI003EBA3CEE